MRVVFISLLFATFDSVCFGCLVVDYCCLWFSLVRVLMDSVVLYCALVEFVLVLCGWVLFVF